jgi:hypothetical protein
MAHHAPSIAELLNDPTVLRALEDAWNDSLPDDPGQRHEEGGWVYADVTSGTLSIRRASAGVRASVDLNLPPLVLGSVVVATFLTHPNPSSEGWETGPGAGDTASAVLFGVPCLIRAEDGIHVTGPDSRRGGLGGNPGYPD